MKTLARSGAREPTRVGLNKTRDVILESRTWTRVRLDSDSSPVFWDLDLDLDLRPVESDLDLELTPPDLRLGLDTSGLEPDFPLT